MIVLAAALTLVIAVAAGLSVAFLMLALDSWLERHYYQ